MFNSLRNRLAKIKHKEYDNIDGDSNEQGDKTPSSQEDVCLETFTPKAERTEDTQELHPDTFTVEQAVDAIGFGKFQVKLFFVAGLAWVCDAMEMMLLSVLGPALRCEWNLQTWEEALITTVVFIGMSISSWMWGSMCDKYGRKTTLITSSMFVFHYGLLSTFSPSLIWIWILRGLVGFGIGGAPQAVTLYSEFLPSTFRAKGLVLFEMFWAAGTCIEVALAVIVMPTLGWRWLLGLSSVPVLIFILACLWLPESARYEMTNGRHDVAYAIIERIAKDNNKPMPEGKLIHAGSVNPEQVEVKRGRVQDLFTPDLRITTIILLGLWFSSSFCYYGIALLTTELFDEENPCYSSVGQKVQESGCFLDCKMLSTKDYLDLLWTTVAEFPGQIITLLAIDYLGRKKTIALDFFVFSVFVLLVCTCPSRTVLIVFIFVARAFISGAFQACYVYTPEVYPTTTRAIGVGVCSGMSRIGAMITPFVAQVLLRTSIYIPVSIYGGISIVTTIAALLLPIETKGREMKDTH
ncbi:synaptic vesicle 2-related protein [Lingula anatina]|uniref:Synaptic vesicle 2-related protein n=1 Tax=Lingula anatina TaxID=7574 RepID=A0A1S3ICK3_LINAN|nr:synaptic vesicle 2-related protein [Lingula anatina]|eukprot:XP_013395159.1 synaptic vesicle 2-related protein [Lingula anatina]